MLPASILVTSLFFIVVIQYKNFNDTKCNLFLAVSVFRRQLILEVWAALLYVYQGVRTSAFSFEFAQYRYLQIKLIDKMF